MHFKLLVGLGLGLTMAAYARTAAPDAVPAWRLTARIIAVGLPGVAGVQQVGRFHSGGPIPGNPEFLLRTGVGRVLDPKRVLVAVAGNFGAPRGHPSHAAGSVLSIDVNRKETIVVPADFAVSGGQSQAVGGAIQLYTAQSKSFLNRRYSLDADTAAYAAASAPRYVSINNAFGRPWIANAPNGLLGEGSVTVVDPDGAPLDNPPSSKAGGVFAGGATNRERTPTAVPTGWLDRMLNYRVSGQLTPGSLATGALGTAFLGPSPDGSGFATFATVTANGAVAQIHVQDGTDGLAMPGTIHTGAGQGDPGVIGMAFKWNADRVLYVADPGRDRLVLLHLRDDRRHFIVAGTTAIAMPALVEPVDIAPAVPEIANPSFASHTTLAGGSDLYVANRGDGSLLRVSQDGRALARAQIEVPGLGTLSHDRIRAIAVSSDAQRIWLTLQGELPGFAGHDGVLIEVDAFDENGPFSREQPHLDAKVDRALSLAGEQAFRKEFNPEAGLGPLFNARTCLTCHPGPGGMSASEDHFVQRVARMDMVTGRVTPIDHPNSPVARRHSTRDLGESQAPSAALPRQANVVSLRMPLALHAGAQLDEIPDVEIVAQAVGKGDGIKGRVHYVTSVNGELRVGRYGWKAHIATLEEMVADAFANELGIISSLAPHSQAGPPAQVEDDGSLVRAVTAYLRGLRLPGTGTSP